MAKSRKKARRAKKNASFFQKYQNWIIAWIIGVALIAGGYFLRQSNLPDIDVSGIPDNSVVYANLGREHIEAGDPHDPYNSNPPTSGPHTSSISTGVYTRAFPDENLIHNLEHGHIWLSYRDADDSEALSMLRSLQSQFPGLVVVTYRPENDARVTAAAWLRLLNLDELNRDEILAFVVRHVNNAPESVSG